MLQVYIATYQNPYRASEDTTMNSTTKRDQFVKQMQDIINGGALNVAMAIGYRLGLFEALAAEDSPRGASEIAAAAGLNPRYTDEWLGVMSTGNIVEVSRGADGSSLYLLPPEHACYLTRNNGDANLGVYTQETPLLGICAMKQLMDCFITGKGISPAAYSPYLSYLSSLSNDRHHDNLVDVFLPAVDGGNLVKRLEEGISVCDFGCGEGVSTALMAKAFPNSTFVGIDISPEAINAAAQLANEEDLDNVSLIVCDVTALVNDPEFTGAFDFIFAFDAIHDLANPLEALRGVHHMLGDNGVFSMVDISAHSAHIDNLDHPFGPFLYTVSLLHTLPASMKNGGEGLGIMLGQEQATDLLKEAGFNKVTASKMEHDPFNVHFECRKD